MKEEKNILIAFILNFGFAIFEFFGGIITNSIAIMSDAVHDIGDALSIGISFFLEKKSKKKPDSEYTYGYTRYSVIGSLITTIILLVGSIFVIYNAIVRIINPVEINYSGMIVFAVIGTIVNFLAAYFTKEGNSLNQKAVNLHMIEDVLGWIIVLIGAILMKFTDIRIIDSVLSIFVAIFIFKNAFNNLKKITDLFLEKIPNNISIEEIKEHILKIKGVEDIHHIHIWSIDGYHNYLTMHVVVNSKSKKVKEKVKEELKEFGINHSTLEIEDINEHCYDEVCEMNTSNICNHHHHHH